MIEKYLLRSSFLEQQIFNEANSNLNMIVVIPARNEPKLTLTLESLLAANQPFKPYEIIIVFNHPEEDSAENKLKNKESYTSCIEWIDQKKLTHIHCILAFDLPKKHAGVGLARKIGMDEAVSRFSNNSKGIIVALDSDCVVNKDYLLAIEDHFNDNPDTNGASIYFEHPLDEDEKLREGITQYELHLRYYNQLLKYAGHPFAFHTVGSSMAVRVEAYVKQGGMNKRKAGEDFYFLQKIIQLGNYSEIKNAIVYPSARISYRVPFGTGRAMGEWVDNKKVTLSTYHPDAGKELQLFFNYVKTNHASSIFKGIPESVAQFIGEKEWEDKMEEIRKNTKSNEAFMHRFFSWFNLFMCFKYVHYYRDNYKANIAVEEAASSLLNELEGFDSKWNRAEDLLHVFRKREK